MKFVSLQDFVTVAPLLVLFALSLIPLFTKVFMGNREPNPVITLIYNIIGLAGAAGLTVSLLGAKQVAFSDAILLDGIAIWTSTLVYGIAGFCLMLAYDHIGTRGKQFTEFCFLLMNSVIGMVILIMSNDLVVTFIGIELMSLCLYILIAMGKEAVLSKEAAFKYFLLGSFASAIFLYGVALIYGSAGGTSFTLLAQNTERLIGTNRIFLAGAGLVVIGFLFKVSIFPLHSWVPDVYQGAATPVTAFMATAVKAATFVAFFRFIDLDGFSLSVHLLNLLMWLSVLTMMVGNVAALMQTNLKRIFAYSGIAHSGYAMIALIAAGFGSNRDAAATSLLFYLFTYSIMTMGAFAIVALFEKHENVSLSVNDLKGLARKFPVLGLCLTVLMLSLAGIPPTLGFFSKFYVFSAAIEQDMYWLVFWGVLSSAISVYYYLRPVVAMYMETTEDQAVFQHTHLLTRATMIAAAVLIVACGLFSSPVLRAVQRTVLGLL